MERVQVLFVMFGDHLLDTQQGLEFNKLNIKRAVTAANVSYPRSGGNKILQTNRIGSRC